MRPSRTQYVVGQLGVACRAFSRFIRITPETIGMALAMRDLKQHLRETGESKGYNASFSREDRSRFLGALDQAVRRAVNAAIAGNRPA